MRDSNPPLKHGKNGTLDAKPENVDPIVDLDDSQTAELLTIWQQLNVAQRQDLLDIARAYTRTDRVS